MMFNDRSIAWIDPLQRSINISVPELCACAWIARAIRKKLSSSIDLFFFCYNHTITLFIQIQRMSIIDKEKKCCLDATFSIQFHGRKTAHSTGSSKVFSFKCLCKRHILCHFYSIRIILTRNAIACINFKLFSM